jgi:N-acetylglucosaminyl-diphospho-decaprenol L-rhamnosyltransferase
VGIWRQLKKIGSSPGRRGRCVRAQPMRATMSRGTLTLSPEVNGNASPSTQRCHEVAIVIVGYGNAEDISGCLAALGVAEATPSFDVFVCENGGAAAYEQLIARLVEPHGPCVPRPADAEVELTLPSDKFIEVSSFALKTRFSRVFLAHAAQNLGYAAAINAWLARILPFPGWGGVWILNPDTEPEPTALKALVDRANMGKRGMVGSTIVAFHDRDQVACRGGLHWRKLMTQPAAIGFSEHVDAPVKLDLIETKMDCASGASMYVTRCCIKRIGLMDERFFLYYEDLDWGLRAKACGLGYASASIVAHKRGTTIGSARSRAQRSTLSVYLENRNRIQFVRKQFPSRMLLTTMLLLVYSAEYLVALAPQNFLAALQGVLAALRGETGTPPAAYHRAAHR